jgi:hypothetical protein
MRRRRRLKTQPAFHVRVPASLSHSLIFYSAGYAVAKTQTNGLWTRGGLFPVEKLDRVWLPYIEGRAEMYEALRVCWQRASLTYPKNRNKKWTSRP